jgi:hypothetical protein
MFSRRHYRQVSPPSDTPEQVAERIRLRAISEQAVREREELWPELTAENVAEALAWQTQRIHDLTYGTTK